jgi:hypothetical protein
MNYQPSSTAKNTWHKMNLCNQMANIGSEVIRAINWKIKKKDYSKMAAFRAIELFNLTINDSKNAKRLKEICRAKEVFLDYIKGENEYGSTDKNWTDYFNTFNYYARLGR